MAIFKRGRIYHYNFWWAGQHIQRSTRQGNPRVARQMEAAHRTTLAKGEVGIFDRKSVPTFTKAMTAFLKWSEQEHMAHPRTHVRNQVSSTPLLRYFKEAQIDQISSADVEDYKSWRARRKERTHAGRFGQQQ